MNKLKVMLQAFIETLHLYDYILFSISGALFLLLLFLAILLRSKVGVSLTLVIVSFIILISVPIFGYNTIHNSIYKTKLSDLSIKRLEFSEAVVIKGRMTNLGQESFKKFTISSFAYKGASNCLEELVHPL